MKENIIVIGTGIDTHIVAKSIAHLVPDDLIIINPENVKKEQLPFPKSEPFILHNPNPLVEYNGSKQFICKGKHQYSLVDTIKTDMGEGVLVKEIWKCQCGKVLGK